MKSNPGYDHPYQTGRASVQSRHERIFRAGHQDWVFGACPVTVAGQDLLASAGRDGTVRIWDPQTGQRATLAGHQGSVHAVCQVTVAGQDLLATAGEDHTVRIWDLDH
jgi:WD40 repeat protein